MSPRAAQKETQEVVALHQHKNRKTGATDLAESIFQDLRSQGLNWREILQVSSQILSLVNADISKSAGR